MQLKSPAQDVKIRLLPWIVAISFFMQMLDTSILNTALPSIASSFGTDPLRMHAVIISYMLTVATIIPASGWLADRFGTRQVFFTSILLFTLGSLACAVAQNLHMLVAARVLQGVGGALLMPVGRLSVMRAVPRADLVRVLSFVTIPGLLGPLVGPTLGGILVHYATWHWIFLINIPVGLLGAALILYCMPDFKETASKRFDVFGFLLTAVFMVSMTVSIEGLGDEPLPPEMKAALFACGSLCLIVYIRHAFRVAHPLFSPYLFRTRNFTVGIIGNLLARLGTGAVPFLTPLLLQVGLGYSPVKAGLTMLPITLGAMAAKGAVNRLLRKFGYRWFLFGNTLFVSLMLSCVALIGSDTPYLCILLIFFASGMANSFQFTAMNTVTLLDLPDEQAGSGNSLLSAAMQLAMSMGVAFGAFVLDAAKAFEGSVLASFHYTFLVLGAVSAFSSLIFLQARHTEGYRKQRAAAEYAKEGASSGNISNQ